MRRLQRSGVLKGFRAEVDPAALGLHTSLIVDVQLREDVNRKDFEAGLSAVPQVISAVHLTGQWDYQLRVVCADTAEFETVIEVLRQEHGVRRLESHLVLREVHLGLSRLLNRADISVPAARRSRDRSRRSR